MRDCLPSESNLKAELAANLANECERLGERREARAFRLTSHQAHRADLWAAANHESDYYRIHYDAIGRIGALWRLIVSHMNRMLWGYGERAAVLLRNLALIAVLIFPIVFLLCGRDVTTPTGEINYWDALLLSVASLVNSSGIAGFSITGAARIWVVVESALGLITLALYVTYLLRWITRR